MLSRSLLQKASVWAFVATGRSSCRAFSSQRLVTSSLHRPSSSLLTTTTTTTTLSMSSSAAAPPTMYILTYTYIPDVLEKRGPFREKHLSLAQDLAKAGRCSHGGPTTPHGCSVPTGAVFVFSDLEAAQEFVKDDPYVSGGIVTDHKIEEWTVAIRG